MIDLRCGCGKKLGEAEPGNYKVAINCRKCKKNRVFVGSALNVERTYHPHFEDIIAPTGMRANNTSQ